jgi:hypothetical protein
MLCSARRQLVAESVDVVHQVDPLPAAPQEVSQIKRLPRQFLRIDQKHIHYIHLIHQFVGKPQAKGWPRQQLRSVAGRFRRRHGVQQLAPGARAGQHHLVDLTFTDLRQLADVAAGLSNIIHRHSSASALRARWARSGSSRLCSFPNSPSTNPSSSSRRMRAIRARPSLVSGDLDANQSEWRAPFLMPGKPVPQTHHEDPQQLIDCVEAVERGQFSTPQRFHRVEGRCRHDGRSDITEKPRAHRVEWHGAPIAVEESSDLALTHG